MTHGRLLERLSEAEKDLDRRIADSIEAERRNALSQPLGTAAEVAAGGAAAAPSVEETLIAPAFVAERLESTEGPATDAQVDLDPQDEPVADFDPDVAGIFTEEATELLEVCESQLAAWRDDPGSADRPAALKRPLHTLKGEHAWPESRPWVT